jgi:hypothetical protein
LRANNNIQDLEEISCHVVRVLVITTLLLPLKLSIHN